MRSRHSSKPCPVCKNPAGYEPQKGACSICLALIEEGKKHLGEVANTQMPMEEYIVLRGGDSYGRQEAPGAWKEIGAVEECVNNLVTALHGQRLEFARPDWNRLGTTPLSPQLAQPFHSKGYDAISVVRMAPAVADQIRELNRLIPVMVSTVYAVGLKRGSNSLLQLASGRLTVNDFNEATLNTDKVDSH
jgi:hypothetical protein